MQPQRGDGERWLLYWTARGQEVPYRLVPLLGRWSSLDEREADAGIGPRDPILIDPQYRIDPVLGRFLRRSRFAWLADGSREAYARDYRLFFSFLWGRGKYWHEAGPDDLLDWEAWRRRDQPGRRISGSKWQRELAALRLLYEWAEKREHIGRSPVLFHEMRLRDGTTVMAVDQAPRDVRSSDVKWLTPRTYRLWRDVGLAEMRPAYPAFRRDAPSLVLPKRRRLGPHPICGQMRAYGKVAGPSRSLSSARNGLSRTPTALAISPVESSTPVQPCRPPRRGAFPRFIAAAST